jgi:hypothetical protein
MESTWYVVPFELTDTTTAVLQPSALCTCAWYHRNSFGPLACTSRNNLSCMLLYVSTVSRNILAHGIFNL